jgi:FG-GAP-like repeat
MKSTKIYFFGLILLLVLAAVLMRQAGEVSAQTDAFAAFDEWVVKYLGGDLAGETDFVQTGERLAMERRELFKDLIRTNPSKAIERAVSGKIQERLPASVAQFLEREISARGDYNVYVADDFDSRTHRVEREFVVGDARYEAFVYGAKERMTTKLDIPLRGVVLDNLLAIDENSVRIVEKKERIAAEIGGELVYFADEREFDEYVRKLSGWERKISPSTANVSPWTEGSKTLLFIRIDFPDRPGEPTDRFGQPLNESTAQNLIDGVVNTFYVNNSYGKTSLRATVTPVVRMPLPQSAYPRDSLFALVTDARNAARAAGFETNNFNLDMVAYSYTTLHDFSGISPIANKGALLNGSFTFKVATHELGHAYGLMHANLWRTFDGTIIGDGANVEYGDDFDMMGRGATQETHFNASYKRDLEWMTEENVKAITQNGVYRVYAYDTESLSPNIRALKVRKDAFRDYWIEFRQQLAGFPNISNGAIFHWEYPFNGWRQTQLLDMNPATTSLADASLLIGNSFSDAASGVKFTVLGKGGTTPESLDIKVEFNFSVINGAPFDFDGDSKTDVSIFRPNGGEWWYLRSSDNQNRAFQFGSGTDKITPADFTGDGKTDIAFWRGATGEWFVLRSEDNSFYSFPLGSNGDIPAVADYDGDKKADAAVFRPSSVGTWYVNMSAGGILIAHFGQSGDVPVAADYDNDRIADIAIYRPSNGQWWIQRSTAGLIAFQFGNSSDKLVPADYTGDGKADAAFFRPSDGFWYVLRSEDFSFYAAPFGTAGDIPVAGDYDGDGKADLAVFRPTDANWYLQRSQSGFTVVGFGANGDVPVPARINP